MELNDAVGSGQWAEFWCQLLLRRYKEMIIFPGTVCGVVVVFFFAVFWLNGV